MASRAYKPGEYFLFSVVAKSSVQGSEQSVDNSVDISRKDLDDHEPVVCESTRESWSTLVRCRLRVCHLQNQRSHGEKRAC